MSQGPVESNPAIEVRRLKAADAPAFRRLRLEALATAPEAFAASYEEESGFSNTLFRERAVPAEPSAVFGAFAGPALVGMAGFLAGAGPKKRHLGMLWGVFVQLAWRGNGVGERLVQAVLDHAARHVLAITATVATENRSARALYHRLGFAPYGMQPKALRVGERYIDEELLALDFSDAAVPPKGCP